WTDLPYRRSVVRVHGMSAAQVSESPSDTSTLFPFYAHRLPAHSPPTCDSLRSAFGTCSHLDSPHLASCRPAVPARWHCSFRSSSPPHPRSPTRAPSAPSLSTPPTRRKCCASGCPLTSSISSSSSSMDARTGSPPPASAT